MDHAKALQHIKSKIGTGRGCLVASNAELAEKLSMYEQNVARFFRGDRPIPDPVLEFFGLSRVKHPDTYIKKS